MKSEEEKDKLCDELFKRKEANSSDNWNKHRKMNLIIESLCIIIILCFIIAGIIFDNEVKNGLVRIEVEEFNSLIVSILSIQATISTLTIAMVALISNNISESYMGISVSHYYLNIRPIIFKQNIIIYSVLGLLSANILFYIFGCYNLILFIFAATILLIFLSAYELYHLFRGIAVAYEEIELFIIQFMDKSEKEGKEKYYNKKVRLLSNLVNDWSANSEEQIQIDYDEYKDVFLHSFQKILIYNTDDSLLTLKQNCKKMIYSLLHSSNDSIQERGIEFLCEIYNQMWVFVISSDYKRKYKIGFDLFSETIDPLIRALKRMPIDIIEGVLEWKNMSDTISRVAFCLMPVDGEVKYSPDLNENIRFSLLIPFTLNYKEQRNKEILEPVIKSWGRALYNPLLDLAYNIPDKRKEEFLLHKCKIHFYYCRGFIDYKYISVVKENIFYRSMSNSYHKESKINILYYLSIDCYLYYLAEKESESCIVSDLKKAAINLLEDRKVRSLNEYYFSRIKNQLREYSELESDLWMMLSGCEWSPKFENVKSLIMENVIREFYVFLNLISSYKYDFSGKNFEILLKDAPFIYIDQFLEGQEKNTKKNLKKFYMLYSEKRISESENIIDNNVNQMYKILDRKLKSLFKMKEVEEAKKEQEKYNTETDKDAFLVSIQNKIADHLKNTFNKLVIRKNKPIEKWTATVNLLDYDLYTNMISENLVENIYSDIDGNFISYIINEVLRRGIVSEIKRSKFMNDLEYIEFLKSQKVRVLMGTEYVLQNIDYTYTTQFNSFVKTCESIFAGYYLNGALALKEGNLQVKIKEVNISIRPLSLKDIISHYNENENTYSYNVTNDIWIPFHEDELLLYINNKQKNLNISLGVEILVSKNDIGIFITRDDTDF